MFAAAPARRAQPSARRCLRVSIQKPLSSHPAVSGDARHVPFACSPRASPFGDAFEQRIARARAAGTATSGHPRLKLAQVFSNGPMLQLPRSLPPLPRCACRHSGPASETPPSYVLSSPTPPRPPTAARRFPPSPRRRNFEETGQVDVPKVLTRARSKPSRRENSAGAPKAAAARTPTRSASAC